VFIEKPVAGQMCCASEAQFRAENNEITWKSLRNYPANTWQSAPAAPQNGQAGQLQRGRSGSLTRVSKGSTPLGLTEQVNRAPVRDDPHRSLRPSIP
jgi:hypothetical protein